MTEQVVLRGILNDRRVYEAFRAYGDGESLSPIGRLLVRFAGEYYGNDPDVQCCSDAVIVERATRELSNPKHAEALKRTVNDLPADSSGRNCIRDILDIKRRGIGGKLALALANGAPLNEVRGLIDEYNAVPEGATDGAEADSAVTLLSGLEQIQKEPRQLIKVWPKALNERLDGGASKGHHILIYARPEKGKTLFAINMACGFLAQKLKVLYAWNEEPWRDVLARFCARILKIPAGHVRRDPTAALEQLKAKDLGELVLPEEPTTDFRVLRRRVELHQPDVVVLDQLRNMSLESDGRTAQLEAAANAARAIGRDTPTLMVSVTQAGDSATGKLYLALNDVDSSKTGIPAAMDLMVGVSGDDKTGIMGISTPKNKIGGQHDEFTVSFTPSTGIILS